MNTRTRIGSALIAAAVLLPLAAPAAGLGFLRRTPIYYFTDGDLKLMSDAALQILNGSDPSAQREWNNPKTGYSGKVQGLGRFKSSDGLDCRKLKLWNQAKGIEGESTFPVCRSAGGEWQLASGKELTQQD